MEDGLFTNENNIKHHSLQEAWRLMGGRQLDLALQKVTFIPSPFQCSKKLILASFIVSSLVLRAEGNLNSLFDSVFSGLTKSQVPFWPSADSFLGVMRWMWLLEDSAIISFILSSKVGGKSYNRSLLEVLDVPVTFLEISTKNASRLGSYLVQNLRLKTLDGCEMPLSGSSQPFSSRKPKKEVFSGEQMSLSDSILLVCSSGSVNCCGRYIFCQETLLLCFFWKKSLGSLFLLILMKLGLFLGSLIRSGKSCGRGSLASGEW